jgi:hypothetical protein
MGDTKVMKDIGLNDPVTVTLPAHVWAGFLSAYASTKWHSPDADTIGQEAVDQIFNPLYIKEREVANQAHQDQHESMFRMFTGGPPGVPLHMEDPEAPPQDDDGGMI